MLLNTVRLLLLGYIVSFPSFIQSVDSALAVYANYEGVVSSHDIQLSPNYILYTSDSMFWFGLNRSRPHKKIDHTQFNSGVGLSRIRPHYILSAYFYIEEYWAFHPPPVLTYHQNIQGEQTTTGLGCFWKPSYKEFNPGIAIATPMARLHLNAYMRHKKWDTDAHISLLQTRHNGVVTSSRPTESSRFIEQGRWGLDGQVTQLTLKHLQPFVGFYFDRIKYMVPHSDDPYSQLSWQDEYAEYNLVKTKNKVGITFGFRYCLRFCEFEFKNHFDNLEGRQWKMSLKAILPIGLELNPHKPSSRHLLGTPHNQIVRHVGPNTPFFQTTPSNKKQFDITQWAARIATPAYKKEYAIVNTMKQLKLPYDDAQTEVQKEYYRTVAMIHYRLDENSRLALSRLSRQYHTLPIPYEISREVGIEVLINQNVFRNDALLGAIPAHYQNRKTLGLITDDLFTHYQRIHK